MMKSSATPDSSSLRLMSLFLLVLQNTSLVIVMRWSLVSVAGPRYAASTVVASMELLKLITCLIVVFISEAEYKLAKFSSHVIQNTVGQPMEMVKLAVPSLLYTIQNNLLFVALANLDVATYQVCYQLKILTTALFSVLMLRKRLLASQWEALILLTVGVAAAQLASSGDNSNNQSDQDQNALIGLMAILAGCVTSGFSGVYFEKILKGSLQTSLWMRNVQMGTTATILAFISVYTKDAVLVQEAGFFGGYNGYVLLVIVLQALGGLLVAVVVKYADNILKGFATGISIILSCILSIFLFGFVPNVTFLVGAFLVLISVHLYGSNRPQSLFISSFSIMNIQQSSPKPSPV